MAVYKNHPQLAWQRVKPPQVCGDGFARVAPDGDPAKIGSQGAPSEIYRRTVFAVTPEVAPDRIAKEGGERWLGYRGKVAKVWRSIVRAYIRIEPSIHAVAAAVDESV